MINKFKIDFVGGSHGNWLELCVNACLFGQPDLLRRPIFSQSNAVHALTTDIDYMLKRRRCCADHYTSAKHRFSIQDKVIRIKVTPDMALIYLTNAICRAGRHRNTPAIDIWNLECNTEQKLTDSEKPHSLLQTLRDRHGHASNYSRAMIREIFWWKFSNSVYWLDNEFMTRQYPCAVLNFDMAWFFDWHKLVQGLQLISDAWQLDLKIPDELAELHQQFLDLNQGWQAQKRCDRIIQACSSGLVEELTCTVIDEAYLDHQLGLGLVEQEIWPQTTRDLKVDKK